MSANTTTSYISQIDQSYPLAGQDNNSQGFRDNFKNISAALTSINGDVGSLSLNSVKLTETNDFGNHIIKRATLQNCATTLYDYSGLVQSGTVTVDYTNGGYQKFKIAAGANYFTVTGWPTGAKSGSIVIAISSDTIAGASITFDGPGVINLGPTAFPVNLTGADSQFFQLWNDGTSVYVKGLGGSATPPQPNLDTLTLSSLTLGGTNTYSTSTNYNSLFATLVSADSKVGNIALLPSILTVQITDTPVLDVVSDTVATKFPVVSVAGISVGATVSFPSSSGVYTVTSFIGNIIIVTPAFPIGAFTTGDIVTIKNPEFTYQPRLVTMKNATVTNSTSISGDLKGEISATASSVYVTYADHVGGATTTNKVKISGDNVTMVTQNTATNSTALATTKFVHNIMPYGAIIMWYGLVSAVPSGWSLCNGASNTPDLRGKFIIGASVDVSNNAATDITGTTTQTGGNKDAVVVTHNHAFTGTTDSAGAHHHDYYAGNGIGLPGWPTVEEDGNNNILRTIQTSDAGTHAHTLSGTIASAGESAVNKNLPPYYALCYIMKITGA